MYKLFVRRSTILVNLEIRINTFTLSEYMLWIRLVGHGVEKPYICVSLPKILGGITAHHRV